MLVVGAGVIGLELGSVWARLGAQVTVVEFLDPILPGTDGEVARQFQRLLEKQNFKFHLGHKVSRVDKSEVGVKATIEPAKGGEALTLEADVALIASRSAVPTRTTRAGGRRGQNRSRGQIVIDEAFPMPNAPGIYAIGDVVRGPMPSHKGSEDEGIAVAEILACQAGHVSLQAIPSVVYTSPEVAVVGRGKDRRGAESGRHRL